MICNSGNKKIIELLADNGAEVITKDLDEQTPLHLAVDKGITLDIYEF